MMGPNAGPSVSTKEKNSLNILSKVAVSERSPSDARTAFIFSLCVGEMRVFGHEMLGRLSLHLRT